MNPMEFRTGHAYVTTSTGIIPRFYTEREDGSFRLGREWPSDNGDWDWFEPGTILTFVGSRDLDGTAQISDTKRHIFLRSPGLEVHVIADPDTDVPLITMGQWSLRCAALLENIDIESRKLGPHDDHEDTMDLTGVRW